VAAGATGSSATGSHYTVPRVFDIGSSLRDARVRQELDFPELEQLTKIRPKYLRALEDERFDILPAPTYVRGFLRSYADALGLDGQPFVDEYNSRFTVGEDDTVVRARRVPPPRRERGRADRESRMAVLALLAIAVVTALVIAAWRFGGPENEPVPGLAKQEQATPRAGSLGPTRLVVRASGGDSWMEVRAGSAGGRLLYSGTLEKGQRKSFDGRRLHLALAEPANVSLRVNGKEAAMPAGTTFSVTARRIAPAIP
jgi:cytoskeletal protein RodZ